MSEKYFFPTVEIKPEKPSSVPVVGRLIDRARTRTESLTRYAQPEDEAKEKAKAYAEKLRQEGVNVTVKLTEADESRKMF